LRWRPAELLAYAEQAGALAQEDGAAAPEDAAETRAFDNAVAAALSQIPSRSAVVEMLDQDGLKCTEAAVALGVPLGVATSRGDRARRRIRAHLKMAGFASLGAML
jgi:DNA-directed RNA polymerase specialized sigma24 family protein